MTTSSKQDDIESPCIRNCCLDNDDICMGCFRKLDEIVGWAEATNEKKQQILTNCQKRKETRNTNW